ncbi:hypothetical protein C1645_837727 [Glomus cerebriforme]|uniref:F-box domain-containing protein n=1 Tax=Glomus cerebriforme TaxID=658196 RepID=A0A397SEZ0_9GLOM|nr:hypothetical protein C1645_837727 [Glomus cerebriforme]
MACSKLFSGDLPEITNEIIQHFRGDFSTLYSCILINRLWCRLTIPLLWENPFSNPNQNFHFIEIYLHYLNDDDKTKFNNHEIKINDFYSSDTLFNYPSFIKCLSTYEIVNSILIWFNSKFNSSIYKKFKSDLTTLQLIYNSLFKIFIDNEANLFTFEIRIINCRTLDCFNCTFELILQNPNFICNIKNLKVRINGEIINITKIGLFLSLLSSNCDSISTIHFKFIEINGIGKFSSLIYNSQRNLKKITLQSRGFPLYHSLLSLKNSNCSNTLKTLIFHHINFKNIIVLKEVFDHLNVLESIHIIDCYFINSEFIQQIININKPFKLRSLFINQMYEIEIKPFQLLIQKSNDYLENFGFRSTIRDEFKFQLLEQIKKFCSKIKFLELYGLCENQCIFLLFDIIKNIGQNLNYISIGSNTTNHSSLILQELGQILPFKLKYLNLSIMINTNVLEVFLKNFHNIFIQKLLICNNYIMEYNQFMIPFNQWMFLPDGYSHIINEQDILPFLEKYIVEKKRIEYLAYKDSRDILFLKDEVKKFESYNIKVREYDDLFIHYDNYIGETY